MCASFMKGLSNVSIAHTWIDNHKKVKLRYRIGFLKLK